MTDQPVPSPLESAASLRRVETMFTHISHPHIALRHPPKPTAAHAGSGINAKLALLITALVGTMVCGYIFAVVALISLPAAITSGNLTVIIGWLSSNFLQLVLLPVIIVGQNIQAKAADDRAASTYKDAEAILHECLQLQAHLQAQDKVLDDVIEHVKAHHALHQEPQPG
jgi:hypothetical protein